MNTTAFVAVGLGAAFGACTRWLLSLALNPVLPTLPLGTLASNLIGAYVIGLSVEFLGRHAGLPPEIRLFVITGFLGGLTTFSTYSAEAVMLLERGQLGWFAAHLAGHLVGSVTSTFLGILTVRALVR